MSSPETVELLGRIPGGRDLLDWFDGPPDFGDAEIVGLHLVRDAESTLIVDVFRRKRRVQVVFMLGHSIDVSLRGFGHQNVIGGLTFRTPEKRAIEPWERGVGMKPGGVEIELAPCAGAYGSIRADLIRIKLTTDAR